MSILYIQVIFISYHRSGISPWLTVSVPVGSRYFTEDLSDPKIQKNQWSVYLTNKILIRGTMYSQEFTEDIYMCILFRNKIFYVYISLINI